MTQDAAQLGDVVLDDLRRRRRRLPGPELVDQPVRRKATRLGGSGQARAAPAACRRRSMGSPPGRHGPLVDQGCGNPSASLADRTTLQDGSRAKIRCLPLLSFERSLPQHDQALTGLRNARPAHRIRGRQVRGADHETSPAHERGCRPGGRSDHRPARSRGGLGRRQQVGLPRTLQPTRRT